MRGWSLIELMVGMVISLIILGGLIQFTVLSSQAHVRSRQRVRTATNLHMARDSLAAAMSQLEPGFWQRFPVDSSPFDNQRFSSGISVAASGLLDQDGMVIWDILPTSRDACIYRIVESGYPEWVRLSPADETAPIGLSPTVQPMSVLLFAGHDRVFPLLVIDVLGDVVTLDTGRGGPWHAPSEVQADTLEVICLGMLQVTFWRLVPEPGRKNRLVTQPWVCEADGWHPGRRVSSYTQIDHMRFLPADGMGCDRIVLESVVDPGKPPAGSGQSEVVYAVLEL